MNSVVSQCPGRGKGRFGRRRGGDGALYLSLSMSHCHFNNEKHSAKGDYHTPLRSRRGPVAFSRRRAGRQYDSNKRGDATVCVCMIWYAAY